MFRASCGVAVCLVFLVSASSRAFVLVERPAGIPGWPIALDAVTRVSRLTAEDRVAAILSFANDRTNFRAFSPVSGRGILTVDGTFKLIKNLNLAPAQLGNVRKSVKADRRRRNVTYERLRALVPLESPKEEKNKERTDGVTVFAFGEQDAGHILEYEFIGPIVPDQVENLRAVVELLLKDGKEKLDENKAVGLLSSKNPCMVYLGLVRLKELGSLTAEHFFLAFRSLPITWIEDAVGGVFCHPFYPRMAIRAFPRSVAAFLRDADPERQEAFLARVNWLISEDRLHARESMERAREPVLRALEDMAKKHSQEEEWGRVLKQYQALKKLLEMSSQDAIPDHRKVVPR